MKQSNQKVLITGGSSGIGLALAKKFLENNNTVIITGRNLSKLEKAKSDNPLLHVFQSDVTDDAEVRMLADDIQDQLGGIDVLINNAGIMHLLDTGNEANDLTKQFAEIDINFNSPIRLVHYFLPQLKQSKEAVIVNVSSGLAYVPFAQAPVYSATKSALHFWTRSIRLHLKPHNIKVLELLPPVVDTPLAHGADIAEDDNLKPMPPEKLAEAFWKGYINSKVEITPGISTQLKMMSRFAPRFVFKQLNKQPIPKR
ncbi:uncharacterized oxidoreductase [Algoriphagus locisalis]|uniref:Uncharacterized oxidoreductase n=1 Tax=Algoriphagus locisalis TaxID=305507 RepID=A0A1I7BF32_9BACT|nr:SDR family NAD(P)-dependent oxidoreductase [Algoriphagus locisalis]SFT85803.1 uncharacterized oxidoreductase [Algoriphagus locisalis]